MSSRKPTQIYLMDQIDSKRITIPATHLLPIPEGGIPPPVPWFGDPRAPQQQRPKGFKYTPDKNFLQSLLNCL